MDVPSSNHFFESSVEDYTGKKVTLRLPGADAGAFIRRPGPIRPAPDPAGL